MRACLWEATGLANTRTREKKPAVLHIASILPLPGSFFSGGNLSTRHKNLEDLAKVHDDVDTDSECTKYFDLHEHDWFIPTKKAHMS